MGTPWRATRLWPGETVVVAASGPSLTQAQLDHVRGKARLIAVSDVYRLAPWADVLYSADAAWWRYHMPNLGAVTGIMIGAQDSIEFPAVKVLKHDRDGAKHKFEDGRALHGNNSGAEALHLAYHLAGGLIVTLGCDCGRDAGGRSHFFGEHPAPLRNQGSWASFADSFAAVGAAIAARGVAVINASPASALACFEKMRLEDVI